LVREWELGNPRVGAPPDSSGFAARGGAGFKFRLKMSQHRDNLVIQTRVAPPQ